MHRDAIVIGGSFAGLSAAMYIARALRSVAVLDTGLPRNRFADHSHGFFGQDGGVPGEMLARAREQVAAYPTVSFIEERAVAAEKQGDGFAVRLANGDVLEASRLVLATKYQGKFGEAHNALMTHVGRLTTSTIDETLTAAGIDVARAKDDLETHKAEIEALLVRNNEQAEGLGFNSTPSFIVGTFRIPGVMKPELFKLAIADARAKAKQESKAKAAPKAKSKPKAAPKTKEAPAK